MLLRMQNLEVHRDQRELAETILRAVRNLDRHAIIAGGAPRDWRLGTLANDIDIFINNNVYTSLGSDNFLYLLGTVIDDMTESQYEYTFEDLGTDIRQEYSSPHIQRVIEATIAGQQFQFIICMHRTWNIVSTFPFTASQVWCTPREIALGEVGGSFQAIRDMQSRVLRAVHPMDTVNQRYFQKMIERFPDWELVLPQEPQPQETPTIMSAMALDSLLENIRSHTWVDDNMRTP